MPQSLTPTLDEIVTSRARREPARTALIWHDRVMVLDRFASIVAGRAETIAALVPPGRTVAILMSSTPGVVSTTLAIWRCGSTAVPIDPGLPSAEIVARLRHSQAAAVIAHEEYLDRARVAIAETGTPRLLLVSRGLKLLLDGARPTRGRGRGAERAVFRPGEVAFLAYDAAQGDARQAVVLTHVNVVASALQVSISRGDGPDDVALCAHPLWSVSALVSEVLARLLTGGSIALLGRPEVARLLSLIENHRVTDVALSAEMHGRLIEAGRIPARAVRSVRKIESGDPRLPLTTKRALADRFPGAEMIERYGKLETTDGISMARHGAVFRKPDTVGLPHPGLLVAILDRSGKQLGAGQVGEITCRGSVVMRGYHRAPARTRSVLVDGWFRTGDLGFIDHDGELQLVGERAVARAPATIVREQVGVAGDRNAGRRAR